MDDPGPEQPLAALTALADAVRGLGLAAEVRGTETPSPELRAAAGTGPSGLRDRIICQPDPAGVPQFCWSWGQPISPASDPAAAARAIAAVLRPVEGTQ